MECDSEPAYNTLALLAFMAQDRGWTDFAHRIESDIEAAHARLQELHRRQQDQTHPEIPLSYPATDPQP